jgi:hypothetical protein
MVASPAVRVLKSSLLRHGEGGDDVGEPLDVQNAFGGNPIACGAPARSTTAVGSSHQPSTRIPVIVRGPLMTRNRPTSACTRRERL